LIYVNARGPLQREIAIGHPEVTRIGKGELALRRRALRLRQDRDRTRPAPVFSPVVARLRATLACRRRSGAVDPTVGCVTMSRPRCGSPIWPFTPRQEYHVCR
jgi:hypothetical protein